MLLVALYCAMPRDYLSDTPLLRAMGFLVSQHGQLGAIPPPPFLSLSPFCEHTKWRCDTPLVAQCSATPATVAATPPCSATPFQTQISVRHLPAQGGGEVRHLNFRGCSATPVLHLQNAIKSRKSVATRVARHV